MSCKKVFHISSFNELQISIFVIGYKNIGESILVLLRDLNKEDKSSVVMSMVIDCYQTQQLNLTKNILERYNVKSLDFVCWTHPHCDHSPGIDTLIKDFFQDNIVIFTPKFYFANLSPDLLKNESAKTVDIFNNIWKIVEGHPNFHNIWRTISAYGDFTNQYPTKLISDLNNQEKPLIFYFLTPLGNRTDKYAVAGNLFNSPNELSISFIMSIDGYNFFFGGDTENEHAEGIDTSIIQSMRWIKVPHHCSLGAQSIADRLGPDFDFAASTVYTASNLPNSTIQELYASNGYLHMTQLKEDEDYTLQHEYGIIQYDYIFKGNEALVDITTIGNARPYFPKNSSKVEFEENNIESEECF